MNKDASKENRDRPDILAPPLLIYLCGMGLGFALKAFWPIPIGGGSVGAVIGALVMAAGFLLIGETFYVFRRAGTSVNPYKASQTIVSDGPFQFSRNPIYVGMTLVVIGAGGIADSLWLLLSLILVLPIMQWGVIRREEAYLEAKFGDIYRGYRESVRRWL